MAQFQDHLGQYDPRQQPQDFYNSGFTMENEAAPPAQTTFNPAASSDQYAMQQQQPVYAPQAQFSYTPQQHSTPSSQAYGEPQSEGVYGAQGMSNLLLSDSYSVVCVAMYCMCVVCACGY